jgi:hypothetical protein
MDDRASVLCYMYIVLMFCWPCTTVYQYNETNVMHFLFSLLRIKDPYTFRALLAHPQEVLNERHLYIACVQCQLAVPRLQFHIIRTQYTSEVCVAPAEDEQVLLETCKGPWFSINWMKSASRWFHYTDCLSCVRSIQNILVWTVWAEQRSLES